MGEQAMERVESYQGIPNSKTGKKAGVLSFRPFDSWFGNTPGEGAAARAATVRLVSSS